VQGVPYGTQSQSFPGGVAQSDARHSSNFCGATYNPTLAPATSAPHSPTLPYHNSGQSSHFTHTPSQVAAYPNYHNPPRPTTPSQHSQYPSGASPDHGNRGHPSTNANAPRHSYSSPLTSTPRPIRHADSGSTSHYRSSSATVASPVQGERYLCTTCHNTFSRAHDRKRHFDTHHRLDPVVHRCGRCSKEFSRGDSLKRHADNGCRDSEFQADSRGHSIF
jgi:DNA-directed RNA polymerase subunit RPC12/RpoP